MKESLFAAWPRPWSVDPEDSTWPDNACIRDARGHEIAWNCEVSADNAGFHLTRAQAVELAAIVNAAGA